MGRNKERLLLMLEPPYGRPDSLFEWQEWTRTITEEDAARILAHPDPQFAIGASWSAFRDNTRKKERERRDRDRALELFPPALREAVREIILSAMTEALEKARIGKGDGLVYFPGSEPKQEESK